MSFLSKYPTVTVFTKKSKINTRVCGYGYTLDLTRLVCPSLQSRHLVIKNIVAVSFL